MPLSLLLLDDHRMVTAHKDGRVTLVDVVKGEIQRNFTGFYLVSSSWSF